MLKASASLGEGASAGLSRSWVVSKKHTGAYSGGPAKVKLRSHGGGGESLGGDRIACLKDGDVAFLDVESGQVVRSLRGNGTADEGEGEGEQGGGYLEKGGLLEGESEEEEVVCFALHPSEEEMVTASENLLLRRWSLFQRPFKCLRTIKAHDLVVKAMEYDGTGTLVATASADRTVKVWNVRKGFCTHNLVGHTSVVTGVRFHPITKRLQVFSASDDCTVRVWSLSSGECLAILGDHMSVPTGMVCTPDGATMVTSGRDQVLNIWDMKSFRLLKTLPVYEALEGVVALPGEFYQGSEKGTKAVAKNKSKKQDSFSHGQSLLFAVAGQKGIVRVYRLTREGGSSSGKEGISCQCIAERPPPQAQPAFTGILWRPDPVCEGGGNIVVITEDHNFLFLNRSLSIQKLIVGFNDEIIDIKPVHGSTRFAVATNSPEVRVYDADNFAVQLLHGHSDIVLAIDVSPDGKWLATASKDNTAILWNIGDDSAQTPLLQCKGHTGAVGALSLSNKPGPYRSSGAFVVSGSVDKTLQKWEIPDPKLFSKNESPSGGSMREALRLAVCKAHEKDINHVRISPNDALVASASQDRTIKLWSSNDLTLKGTLAGHKRGVWRVEFSPIDRCLASASGDRTVRVWSLKDFSCMKVLQGHMGSVLNLAFVSGGAQLMTSGGDGLLKLWTLRTAECNGTFDGHDAKVWALAKMSCGASNEETGINAGVMIISGGSDSVINIWRDVTTKEEELEIQEREKLILMDQEMHKLLGQKQFDKALSIAFELKRPNRVWNILNDLLCSQEGTAAGYEDDVGNGEGVKAQVSLLADTAKCLLDPAVAKWSQDRTLACLSYCQEWNTNARTCGVAQAVLGSIVRTAGLAKMKGMKNIGEIATALYPYSERHFRRLDQLFQSTYLADFTLSNMQSLDIATCQGLEDSRASSPALKSGNYPARAQVNGRQVYNILPEDDGSGDSDDDGGMEGDGLRTAAMIGESDAMDEEEEREEKSHPKGESRRRKLRGNGDDAGAVVLNREARRREQEKAAAADEVAQEEEGEGESREAPAPQRMTRARRAREEKNGIPAPSKKTKKSPKKGRSSA